MCEFDKIISECKLLKVESNSVIILRSESSWAESDILKLRNLLDSRDIKNIVFYVDDMSEVYILNEEMMNKYGWYKYVK